LLGLGAIYVRNKSGTAGPVAGGRRLLLDAATFAWISRATSIFFDHVHQLNVDRRGHPAFKTWSHIRGL